MEKILVSWSGGKDSAIALFEILKDKNYQVAALLTTITEDYDRISMHGVRRVLLERQAAALGFALEKVLIPKNASNKEYESNMGKVLAKYKAAGTTEVVFGDIYLEDLRKYREDKLAGMGMRGIFPLWKRDTRELACSLSTLGFQAVTTCVDSQALGRQFVGRVIDGQFLSDLPAGVDPCGENATLDELRDENKRLRKQLRRAELEREILKKATAYFAKESL